MKKVLLFTFLVLTLFTSLSFANEFPDVDASHWAHQYIDELSTKKVINGYTDGTYKPGGTVKKSEFIKLVMATCWPVYIDVDEVTGGIDHWSGPYIRFAEANNVVKTGEYTLENVEEPITRLEMARIVANADIMMLHTNTQFSQELAFNDVNDLGLNDKYLLSHTVSRGLITGYEDGTFKPEKTMTRAEAATMIWRFMKAKEGGVN